MKTKLIFLLTTLFAAAASMPAKSGGVTLAGPFSDGAVLQREMRVPVWGTAAPGECVTVSFGGQSVETTAGKDGGWRVDLEPMEACREGRVLTASGSNGGVSAEAKDVLVGEVWFCSGQSNMEVPITGVNPRFRDGKGAMRAQMTRKPLVRFCFARSRHASTEPCQTFRKRPAWRSFTPENLAEVPAFSAVGVYFALELFSALDMPVGIVGAYWGGTPIEAWTPACGLASVPETAPLADVAVLSSEAFAATPEAERPCRLAQHQPRVLWNEMLAPWTPYAMRGFIWYQGESNVADGAAYASKMRALLNGWTEEFANPDLKLRFVQIAPWGNTGVPALQMAQAAFAAGEPRAAMAVANDVGNLHDIHPNGKETVGQRLALLALEHDYGFEVESDSPSPREWRVEGDAFVVEFDNAKSLYIYNPDKSLDAGLEICGADGKWKPAKIRNLAGTDGAIDGARLVVAAEGVAAPAKLRYLHSRPWFGCLYNEVNLPMGAFILEADEDEASAANLFPNPSFEVWDDGWAPETSGWKWSAILKDEFGNTRFRHIGASDAAAHSGRFSFHMHDDKGGGYDEVCRLSVPKDVVAKFRGKGLRFSVWAKLVHKGEKAGVGIGAICASQRRFRQARTSRTTSKRRRGSSRCAATSKFRRTRSPLP